MSMVMTRLARRISMALGIGRQTADTNESTSTPTVQVALNGGELRSDVPMVQLYGFASRSVPGSDVIVVFQDGDRSRGVAVATGDQRNRPTDLQPGEVCVFHPQTGSRIWMKADGSIAIVPHNGQALLDGTLTVTKDVIANGVSLVNHLTSDVQPGSGQSGPPVAT
ncbi:bacteriophage protein [Neoasaia chiangmaiensis NBRC 101099]|uniref:Bacteriophage Mu Gp45 N-terminal domain-containing protein n=1 Tax=Neoasaia chiangmaiensis TaxID=320497 RepID=A0A1U9KR52_9PROT|nr:phage baseplate assembly protein [Neoasaia chiangmaiensis]AQS88276.1 hypothetical protein A0U93_10350 [Neoasaia chiangmaiensis]GBR39672.1 bacteriophage protein [Neoasaia chiangmaiensis NBRC 101099]GEN14690.1 phage assembly protein [Neoasaia chiangmaiensis]